LKKVRDLSGIILVPVAKQYEPHTSYLKAAGTKPAEINEENEYTTAHSVVTAALEKITEIPGMVS